MAKPKLALIPAAQGTKLYSVLPSDGSGDFDYTRGSSATRINAQGLIESVTNTSSRLNYPLLDGKVVGCPHHLLESQSTNLLPYSEDFSNSVGWEPSGKPSAESNVIISPDGTLNATRLSFGNNNTLRVKSELTFTNAYSYSIFVKKDIGSFVTIFCAFFTTSITVGFDLDNGTCQTGGVIEKYGNDWYRLSISKNVSGDADRSGYFYLYSTQEIGSTSSVSGNKLYVWGAQVEDSSFPTSYIKSNIGSATTRLGEAASGSGNAATFNDSEGVLMLEASALADSDSLYRLISLKSSQSTYNDRIEFGFLNDGIYASIASNNSEKLSYNQSISDAKGFNKISLKYSNTSGCSIYLNGFELNTGSNTDFSANDFNGLEFKNHYGNKFYGNVKQVQYFDTTDIDLEELTSWDSFSDMANGQLYTIE